MSAVGVVIVCHDSGEVLERNLVSLERQSVGPPAIVLVDSGSKRPEELERFATRKEVAIVRCGNIGFGAANNVGFSLLARRCPLLLFLNPDAFLERRFLERALAAMAEPALSRTAVLCGRTFWYDDGLGRASGRLDSTGVFRNWYGRWYDRGQGERPWGRYLQEQKLPAVCGAVMFCRSAALDEVATGGRVFDEDFFLYKEDIELSLRLRRRGWELRYRPELVAFHSRGWQRQRRQMPRPARLQAAASELLLYRKHPSLYRIWARLKMFAVRWLDV